MPIFFELFDAFGEGIGEIVGFGRVVFDIVEFPGGFFAGHVEEFPTAVAEGGFVALTPEEIFMRGASGFSDQVGDEVYAIEVFGRDGASDGGGGGEDIKCGDGFFVDHSGGEVAGPLHEERDAKGAFIHRAFFAAENAV